MARFYDAFTHIDDLREKEPGYYAHGSIPVQSNDIDINKNGEGSSTIDAPVPVKTPVMLLDEGSKRIYQQAPEYRLTHESVNGNITKFVMVCRLSGSETTGEGKTKKAAKHFAASDMLRIMVNKNLRYAKDMGIPSSSVDEALKYIDTLIATADTSVSPPPSDESDIQFDPSGNYVGKLQELCSKAKLANAIYESNEEGSPNDRTFITVCKVGKKETEGSAKQKKASKTLAAFKMVCILEKALKDMDEDLIPNAGEDDIEEIHRSREKHCQEVRNPITAVEEALSDENKFTTKCIEYKILDNRCSFGLKQCMLKVKYVRNAEPESTHIYPGAGDTEDEARDSAARMALLHILAL